MCRIWEKREMQKRFWWGNLREDLELVVEWNGVEWIHQAPEREKW